MDRVYLSLYHTFAFIVRRSPRIVVDGLMNALAHLAYIASPKRRSVIEANLKLCFGNIPQNEQKKIAIRSYKNLVYNIISFIKREKQDRELVLKDIEFANEEIVHNLLKENRKIIFVTAHYGVWEMIPPALTTKFGFSLSIVGRELDASTLQPILKDAREKFSVKLINKRGAMRGMIKALTNGDKLGLLVDQSIPKRLSEDVEFFSTKVTHTPAASILSKKFDAVMVPLFITSSDLKRFTITFHESITPDPSLGHDDDIHRLTQLQADVLQERIEEKRDEWFWSHKRFKVYNSEIYG